MEIWFELIQSIYDHWSSSDAGSSLRRGHYASVNSKHQHPPGQSPGVLHSTAAPGPGFILDDLTRGPGFCISIKLRLVQCKSMLSLNWHLDIPPCAS